jgi:hypothetical protein
MIFDGNASHPSALEPSHPTRLFSKEDTPPVDVRELTIRNLDTGEEFVIGENDPDFEFDTFPITGGDAMAIPSLS